MSLLNLFFNLSVNFFITQDVDYKVREATQQAMEQLVLRVGRNLAPHLRYIIGPWLCTQFDTYAVVASSARKSFHAAFSEEKQTDVIMFCRKDLFEVCMFLQVVNCIYCTRCMVYVHGICFVLRTS